MHLKKSWGKCKDLTKIDGEIMLSWEVRHLEKLKFTIGIQSRYQSGPILRTNVIDVSYFPVYFPLSQPSFSPPPVWCASACASMCPVCEQRQTGRGISPTRHAIVAAQVHRRSPDFPQPPPPFQPSFHPIPNTPLNLVERLELVFVLSVAGD